MRDRALGWLFVIGVLGSVPALGGVPLTLLDVRSETDGGSCQSPPAASFSEVSPFDGGLHLSYGLQGVEGVPGTPLRFTLEYSSVSDNGWDFGTRLNVDVRYQPREGTSWEAETIEAADIHVSDGNGDFSEPASSPASSFHLGFGKKRVDTLPACDPYRSGADLSMDRTSQRIGELDAPADRCWDGHDHAGDASRVTTVSVPVKLAGGQSVTRPGAVNCGAPIVTAPWAGLRKVQAGVTFQYEGPSDAGGDLGYSQCGSQASTVYVQAKPSTSIALMGPQWSHGLATYISYHQFPATGQPTEEYVVLHASNGTTQLYRDPRIRTNPGSLSRGWELHPAPEILGSACQCARPRLYKAYRPATPSLPLGPYFEMLNVDGSRAVFSGFTSSRAPYGRLVRLEERNGRNAIDLFYNGQQLSYVLDSGAFRYDFTYVSTAAGTRLVGITFPGGRSAVLGYDAVGRLQSYRPPGAAPGQAIRFGYGSTLGTAHANDIISKSEPDGELTEYDYYRAGNSDAGRIRSARRGVESFTYSYSNRDEAEYWTEVAPAAPSSAPTIRHEFLSDGRLVKLREICTADCDRHPADPNRFLTSITTETRYDTSNRIAAVLRYPSDAPDHFAKVCYDYDPASGLLAGMRGPACTDAAGNVLGEWGQSDCDDTAQTCAGPVTRWEAVAPPDTPSALPLEARYYRPSAIFSPSQSGPGGRPHRLHYTPDADGRLEYVCRPEDPLRDTPTHPDAACSRTRYESVITGDRSILRVASFQDGTRNLVDLDADTVPETESAWQLFYQSGDSLLQRLQSPLGDAFEYTYYPSGLVATITAPGGRQALYEWTPRGELEAYRMPGDVGLERTARFTFTPGGKPRSIIDEARSLAWWFDYSPLTGRIERVKRGPASNESLATLYEETAYDANGQQTLIVRPGDLPGTTVRILTTYDGHGMPKSRDDLSTPIVDHEFVSNALLGVLVQQSMRLPWDPTTVISVGETFDVAGRSTSTLLAALPGGGPTTFLSTQTPLDSFGRRSSTRTASVLNPNAQAIVTETRYEYDTGDRMRRLTASSNVMDPGGAWVMTDQADVTYQYDDAGRVASMTDPVAHVHQSRTFRADGLLASTLHVPDHDLPLIPREFTTTFQYDSALRLSHVRTRDNYPGQQETHQSFEHDERNRLRHAQAWSTAAVQPYTWPIFDYTYSHDAADDWNLAGITDNLASTTRTYIADQHDRITSPSGFTYDARGNLTHDPQRGSTHQWNADNRLIATTTSAGTTQYAYDSVGRLLAHREPSGTTTLHAWDGWVQSAEVDLGAATARSIPVSGPGGWMGAHGPSGWSSHAVDFRGSRTNYSLAPLYEPLGTPLSPLDSTIGFQQHEHRPESGGLQYMRSRWYDANIGRFVSRDPVLAGQLGNYQFDNGSSVLYWDPSGGTPLITAGIGAAIGGAVGAGLAWYNGASGEEIAYAALKGALTGGVAGLTMGLGGPALAGLIPGTGALSGIAGGALVGAVGSAAGNVSGQALDLVTGRRCEFDWAELGWSSAFGAATGGVFLRPAIRPKEIVTSWTRGVPDLEPGRWVQVGGPSFSNFLRTIGPAIRAAASGRMPNSTTGLPLGTLGYDRGLTGNLAGLLGQRRVFP